MIEKKRDWLERLLGVHPQTNPEPVKAPPPPPRPPEPVPAAATEHALAGPPETTVEFIEEVEAHDSVTPPAPVHSTPIPPAVLPPDPTPAPSSPETVAPLFPPAAPPSPVATVSGWFQRLSGGLKRSSDQLQQNIAAVFTKARLDEATLEDLEDILIQSDFGVDVAAEVADVLRRDRFDRDIGEAEVRGVLAGEIAKVLAPIATPLTIDATHKPFVILMVGVNGTGKTTTIGKLAQKLRGEGRSVMLAAGDTFRAAAIDQLKVWGERTGVPVITRPAGADASGLAFDAVTEAKSNGTDVLIIDTAGRLQNRDELMGELEKIIRVIRKVDPTAPHATLLTLDATTGQNALSQVEIFRQRAGVTGLVMTKLDSTARGGILVAIAKRFALPVHFIGVGEGVEDLQPFAAGDFARAIAGEGVLR
jgi:fused signal recognition particle receptor